MKAVNIEGAVIGEWVIVVRCENKTMRNNQSMVQYIVKCSCGHYFKKIAKYLRSPRFAPDGCVRCVKNHLNKGRYHNSTHKSKVKAIAQQEKYGDKKKLIKNLALVNLIYI